jgi:hypothetical protein
MMQAFGILSSVIFIVPAITSAYIRGKITNRSRAETSQLQPAPATTNTETTPTTLTSVQQPALSDHPQALTGTTGPGADSDPPAYYSIVGEGVTDAPQIENAHSQTGVVEEPYYSQVEPGFDPSTAAVSEVDSPQNAYDYPTVLTAAGGGADDDESYYSRALRMEPVTVVADETGHDEPPSYVSIIA